VRFFAPLFDGRQELKSLRGQKKAMKCIGIGKPRAPATTEPLKQIESLTIKKVEGGSERNQK
jgi:hypothetical protein